RCLEEKLDAIRINFLDGSQWQNVMNLPVFLIILLEPFTSLYLNFQVGGKFDHADRLILLHARQDGEPIGDFLLMLVIFVIILYNCANLLHI
ncbi:hypothetical protein ACJX0J_013678, partial [Zea mays]